MDRDSTEHLRTARERSSALFDELLAASDDATRVAARGALIELHLPLVDYCARRFVHRGEPLDDLVQVGTIGLIKAVDRFDPGRGVEFSTYATPTVVGEIKRHFRDKGWSIRVPRRLQELRMSLMTATSELSQSLSRSPTPRELAEHLGVTVEDVLEGLESANAYAPLSLDAANSSDDAPSWLETLGDDDAGMAHVEIRESLRPLLERLPERERQVLVLRFFGHQTQSQIAAQVGVSQMQVSRMLTRTLAKLRDSIE